MNANRRFLISFVAYLGYFVLLAAGVGASNGFSEASNTGIGGLPAWAGIPLTGVLAAWPVPLLVWFFNRTPTWKKEVQSQGRLASARVLSAKDTGIPSGGWSAASVYADLVVCVMPPDGPDFDGEVEIARSRGDIPAPGEMILVRYDPDDHRRIAPARENDVLANQSPTTESTALDSRMRSTTISELASELRALDEKYQSGSMSDQEFRTARKRLLA